MVRNTKKSVGVENLNACTSLSVWPHWTSVLPAHIFWSRIISKFWSYIYVVVVYRFHWQRNHRLCGSYVGGGDGIGWQNIWLCWIYSDWKEQCGGLRGQTTQSSLILSRYVEFYFSALHVYIYSCIFSNYVCTPVKSLTIRVIPPS